MMDGFEVSGGGKMETLCLGQIYSCRPSTESSFGGLALIQPAVRGEVCKKNSWNTLTKTYQIIFDLSFAHLTRLVALYKY